MSARKSAGRTPYQPTATIQAHPDP